MGRSQSLQLLNRKIRMIIFYVGESEGFLWKCIISSDIDIKHCFFRNMYSLEVKWFNLLLYLTLFGLGIASEGKSQRADFEGWAAMRAEFWFNLGLGLGELDLGLGLDNLFHWIKHDTFNINLSLLYCHCTTHTSCIAFDSLVKINFEMLLMIIAHDQTNQPKNEYKMILNFLWGHKWCPRKIFTFLKAT